MVEYINKAYKEWYYRIWTIHPDNDPYTFAAYVHKNPLMSWLFWKRPETALRFAGPRVSISSVLDYGSGAGVILKSLSDQGAVVTICDPYPEISVHVLHELPLETHARTIFDIKDVGENDYYDYIFALDVLEHVPDIFHEVAALVVSLQKGGMLIISGPTESWAYKLGRWLARLTSPHKESFSDTHHVRTIYDIEKILGDAGLVRENLKRLYWPITLFRVSAWRKP